MSKKQEIISFTVPTTQGTRTVEGKRVTLPGYEAFSLVVHRSIAARNKYTVTEQATGLSLCFEHERKTSQAATVEALRAKFERYNMTPAKLQTMIDSQGAHHARKSKGAK